MKTVLQVRVVPNARRNEVVGAYAEGVKIKLNAPPVDGKANETLIQFLAAKLGCPAKAIAIKSGAKSRSKLVEIEGMEEETVREKLMG